MSNVVSMFLDERQKENLKIMTNPEEWPSILVLPMRKRRDDGNMPDCAILVRDSGPKLYLKNMWDLKTGLLPPQLVGVPVLEFESFEAILRAGWEVD